MNWIKYNSYESNMIKMWTKYDISKLQEQSKKCTFEQNMSKASEIYEILLQHETTLSSELWQIPFKQGLVEFI